MTDDGCLQLYTPPLLQNGGRFVTWYKIYIYLTIEIFLYRGDISLVGTLGGGGGGIVEEIQFDLCVSIFMLVDTIFSFQTFILVEFFDS